MSTSGITAEADKVIRDLRSTNRALTAENERLKAVLEPLVPPTDTDDWWCPECQGAINCATNDERCPDCGTFLGDCQPSYEWAEAARAALKGEG
jgi:rubrerythrin